MRPIAALRTVGGAASLLFSVVLLSVSITLLETKELHSEASQNSHPINVSAVVVSLIRPLLP